MCFSATASFSAAGILIPAGIYCLRESNRIDKRYWAIAILPLMFGLQQLLEGSVWLALLQGEAAVAHRFALGFLLISHVFWLGWIAYSSYLTESSARLRRIFLLIAVSGVLFGASMYVPLLFKPGWLSVSIVKHAIDYDFVFMHDAYVSQKILTVFYAGVILVPLALSSDRYHRMLGGLVLFSGLVSWAFYDWALVSVWCYFAAIISLYIFFMIAHSVQAERTSCIAK